MRNSSIYIHTNIIIIHQYYIYIYMYFYCSSSVGRSNE